MKGKIDPIYKELKKVNFHILEDLCRRERACARESVTKKLQHTLFSIDVPPNRTQKSWYSSPHIVTNSIPSIFYSLLLICTTLPIYVSFQTN